MRQYEAEGRARKTVKAQDLWFAILDAQIETGTPYLLYKDSANRKSNQQNLGTIKSSNLCTEILEFTSPDEVAVCNLASLALPRFVIDGKFDHEKLYEITYRGNAKNLNKIIDNNYYPVEEANATLTCGTVLLVWVYRVWPMCSSCCVCLSKAMKPKS